MVFFMFSMSAQWFSKAQWHHCALSGGSKDLGLQRHAGPQVVLEVVPGTAQVRQTGERRQRRAHGGHGVPKNSMKNSMKASPIGSMVLLW